VRSARLTFLAVATLVSCCFNNGGRNNLRSHLVRSSNSEFFSRTCDPFVR
jgi:hypothetical protein